MRLYNVAFGDRARHASPLRIPRAECCGWGQEGGGILAPNLEARGMPAILRASVIAVVLVTAAIVWQVPAATEADDVTVAAVSAGESHSCALTTGGGVKCWGDNAAGQLGNGTTTASSTPVDVCSDNGCSGSLSGIATVSAGYDYTCAVTTGGGVTCWGYGTGTAVDVMASGVAAVSAGGFLTCALTTEQTPGAGGGVKCWDPTSFPSVTPIDVPGLTSGVVAVSTGVNYACGLTTEPTPGAGGGVKCWGLNSTGQLGNGTNIYSSTPVDVCSDSGCTGSLSGVTAVSAADHHTCALTVEPTPGAGGGVKCWGDNSEGALGNGTLGPQDCAIGFYNCSATPVDVSGLGSGVVAISAGLIHTCALTTGGGVKCWGSNVFGQLGNSTITEPELCSLGFACSTTPVDVCSNNGCSGSLSGIATVSSGGLHICAFTTDGGVKCWGYNINGQLGNSTGMASSTPVDLLIDSDVDGCQDVKEQQTAIGSELSGGRRSPKYQWDYFNPTGDGENRVDDVLAVVDQYYMDDSDGVPPFEPGYTQATDRTLDGPNDWNTGPPNGLQRVDDILNIVKQYFHDCA